jgi:haloacetate dehalogenase
MIDTSEAAIRVRHGGSGPAVLLLHGFPEIHIMWHKIVPRLARARPGRARRLPACARSSQRVDRLAVLDIVPVSEAFRRADMAFVLNFWPWSLLSEPYPVPERLVGGAPEAVLEATLDGWSGGRRGLS